MSRRSGAARRPFAASIAAVIALAGIIFLPSGTAAIADTTPTTSVEVTEAVPGSLTISVAGEGFSTQPPGVYVALGERYDPVDPGAYAAVTYVPNTAMDASGAFTAQLTLDAEAIGKLDRSVGYQVFTFKAHGQAVADPSQNTATSIAIPFDSLQEPSGPSASVEVTEAVPGSLTLSVAGEGFSTQPPGVYVALGDRFDPADSGVYAATAYVSNTRMDPSGAFTVELTLDAEAIGKLDRSAAYQVFTFKAHGQAVADPSQNTATPIAIPFDSLQEPSGPTTSVQVTEAVPGSLTISVAGEDFSTEPPGVYVALGDRFDPADSGVYAATAYVSNTRMDPSGAFTVELTLDAGAIGKLDRSAAYQVFTFKAHGQAVADPSQNTATAITIPFDAIAPAQPAAPRVEVSQTEVSAQGETVVTVTGTGFDPAMATGTRLPLAGKPAGTYVVFGKFAQDWRPSEGHTGSSRVIGAQKWAVPAESMAAVGGPDRGAVELRPDGSFTTELVIDKAAVDAKATGEHLVDYGIYTYPGSGAVAPAYETYTPITFTGPQLAVDVVEQSARGVTLDVTGTGFAPGAPGVYVAFGEELDPEDATGYLAATWVREIGPAGTFSTRLSLDASDVAQLRPGHDYQVFTFRPHGSSDRSQDAAAAVPIDFDAIGEGKPSVTVSVVEASPSALRLRVDGKNFSGASPGLDVVFGPAGDPTKAIAHRWLTPSQIGEDGFRTELVVGTEDIRALDRQVQYAVHTRMSGGSDRSQDTTTPVTIDFDALTPAAGTTLTWGVKESFRNYVANIAHGTIETRGGATTSQGVFGFSEGTTSGSATTYQGAVRFTGHDGTLDLTFAAPRITMHHAGQATLSVEVTDGGEHRGRVDIGVVDVSRGSTSRSGDVMTVRNAPVTLTKIGAERGFDNFYPAGTALDPVTFSTPVSTAGGDGGKPPSTTPAPAPKPKPAPPAAAGRSVRSGSLTWGISSRFRSYVTGPIARGSISLSGGAAASGAGYAFGQRGTNASGEHGVGTTSYGGAVTFQGHGGQLNLRVADPQVAIAAPGSAMLTAAVNGRRVTLGQLDLRAGRRSVDGGAVTYAGVPVTLTAEGAPAFNGFYGAGTALDPVTFTIGANGGVTAGGTRTVAAAKTKDTWKPPANPPATTGIELSFDGDELIAGQEVTATASGFQPNETDIKVVVYSAPIVLERKLTADAAGRATWTGLLPETLEPGEHTLTFQGSVARGAVFTLAREDQGRCAVDDAVLTWGVKESFRAYISGRGLDDVRRRRQLRDPGLHLAPRRGELRRWTWRHRLHRYDRVHRPRGCARSAGE